MNRYDSASTTRTKSETSDVRTEWPVLMRNANSHATIIFAWEHLFVCTASHICHLISIPDFFVLLLCHAPKRGRRDPDGWISHEQKRAWFRPRSSRSLYFLPISEYLDHTEIHMINDGSSEVSSKIGCAIAIRSGFTIRRERVRDFQGLDSITPKTALSARIGLSSANSDHKSRLINWRQHETFCSQAVRIPTFSIARDPWLSYYPPWSMGLGLCVVFSFSFFCGIS